MSGLIAIVGRPNVGKSALFNRLVRRRIAIVHDQPGVTRDRVSAEAEWHGRPFTLVDTGGIGLVRGEKADDEISRAALEQVKIAIEAAQVILLVVDAHSGLVPLDKEVAARLRAAQKPVVVVVNKTDNEKFEDSNVEFVRLGFAAVYSVSALHGRGIEDLMNAVMDLLAKALPESGASKSEQPGAIGGEPPLKIAIVGRPNVGKSSIINALTRSERVIVSSVPGTTRDAVDVPFEVETDGVRQSYILIDTAGMRKKRRVDDTVEFFSVGRSEESIARCDIAVLVMDAEQGLTEQDKKIADCITENQRACVMVINKWDLVNEAVRKAQREAEPDESHAAGASARKLTTLAEFANWVQERMFFLDYAPVIFTSAKSGMHLDRLLEAIRFVAAQLKQQVPTSVLNRVINDAVERRQPVSNMGHRLKFFYATQVKQAPPTFVLFVNRDELFSDPYKKYLAGEIRKAFGFEGCPIILLPRPRPKTIAPKRRFEKPHQNKRKFHEPRRSKGRKQGR